MTHRTRLNIGFRRSVANDRVDFAAVNAAAMAVLNQRRRDRRQGRAK